MSNHFNQILNYWQSKYSSTILNSNKFNVPEHFKKMADLMAPGLSYYYIVNFHTLELEHVSDSVETFTGEKPSMANMDKLLSLALPNEIEKLHKKEQVIRSFFQDYLKPNERLHYKVSYIYKNRSYVGKERVMLHQATALTVDENGQFVHVFSIHSDISHLNINSTDEVSFININGGDSFYNISTESGKFNFKKLKGHTNIKSLISPRELEVVEELAKGSSSKEIAKKLYLSVHTVNTHKKNILSKVNCKNTTHLVSICLAEGIIQI